MKAKWVFSSSNHSHTATPDILTSQSDFGNAWYSDGGGAGAGLASGALLSQMLQLATYSRPKGRGDEHLKKHGWNPQGGPLGMREEWTGNPLPAPLSQTDP